MSNFEKEFFAHYLNFGLGSMPKSDIDALVMHLIDRYGVNGHGAMSVYSNQTASERLKTSVGKIKKLRCEAALKFSGRVEDQAMGRLLASLSNATIEPDGDKICLIIEDSLAKNWLQGQLKIHQQIFDHSFNAEIIKVSSTGLFTVLLTVFDLSELEEFKRNYEDAKNIANVENRKIFFKSAAIKFAEVVAKKLGEGVVTVLKAKTGLL